MAIAFDIAGSAVGTTGSVLSWTHTVTGNNPILLVGYCTQQTGGTLASLKYGNNALTKIIGTSLAGNQSEMWYLLNPPTGLGTINGTMGTNTGKMLGISVSLTGVNQTTPILGSVGSTVGNGTSGSLTQTIASDSWYAGFNGYNDQIGTSDISTGQVQRGTLGSGVAFIGFFDTNSTGGTVRWSFPVSTAAIVASEIGAAPVVASAVRRRRGIGS